MTNAMIVAAPVNAAEQTPDFATMARTVAKKVKALQTAKAGVWSAIRDAVIAGLDMATFKEALSIEGVPVGTVSPYLTAAYRAQAIDALTPDASIDKARKEWTDFAKASPEEAEGVVKALGGKVRASKAAAPAAAAAAAAAPAAIVFEGFDPADLTVDGTRVTRDSVIAWALAQSALNGAGLIREVA